MTLSYGFRFQNPDSTATLNARLIQLVQRGVYWGGAVAPGVGMTVTVAPLLAVAYDGGTVAENAIQTLVVAPGVTYYIVLRAKYNAMGVPALPTLQWQALTAAAYAADPEINYLIVLATVTAAGPAVLATDIDMSVRDEVTPLGRAFMRGVAANVAALPTTAPLHNVTGDTYFVIADGTFYYWTGAAWSPFLSGSYNVETIAANHALVEGEIERRQNGSGVISGPRAKATPTEYGTADLDALFLPVAVVDQIALDSLAAVVNGHYVVTAAQVITLPAGGVDRYDIVFLEVWREALAVPETQNYERNPIAAPPPPYTLTLATDKVERLGFADGTAGDNFNFHSVGEYAHGGYAVRFRIASSSGGGAIPASALYNPLANATAGLVQNLDGNFFTGAPGSGDQRLWSAASAVSVDLVTWAIPLFVIHRVAGDMAGPPFITEFRSGVRHVFPVYPTADVGKTSRDLAETTAQNSPLPLTTLANNYPAQEPSGWLAGQDYDVQAGAGGNTIRFYEAGGQFKARIRGFDDWISFNTSAPSLGAAPALANQWARTLVYLKLSVTMYANEANSASNPLQFISPRHRPLLPSMLPAGLATTVSQGWKRGFVTYEVVVAPLGASTVLDEDDAMTAAGWTRGDNYVTGTPWEFVDGGIWSKAVAIGVDDRVHPFLTEWAIPICLVHRRNQAAWTLTNPNGGLAGTRPDSHTHDVIDADDILDLRRDAGMTESEAKARLEADVDRLMTGRLRTRMAERWALGGVGANEVAGTRILQADIIGPATPGCFNLTAPDGERMIWSDAREFDVVAGIAVNNVGSTGVVDWNLGGPILTIRAPVGAYLVRQLPAFYLSTWDVTDPSYLHYESSPCWTTRTKVATANPLITPNSPAECEGKYVSFATDLEGDLLDEGKDGTFAVLAMDAYGHAYSMTSVPATNFVAAPAGSRAALSWWVHYDRDPSGVNSYNSNYGLAEVPDEVHSAEWFDGALSHPTGVGTLYVVVRKHLVGAFTTVITLADIDAVKPANVTGATDKLIGISAQFITYSTAPPVAGVTLVEMDVAAQATITITWGAVPWTGYVDIIVFYETLNVDTWIEVGRGGKSVRALFEWSENSKPGLAADTSYAWDIGSYVWQHAEVADQMLPMPVVWKKNGANWELRNVTNQDYYADYPLSNLFSLTFDAAGGETGDFLVYAPARRPLIAGETVTVHYTYSPYQGLSSTGGAVATAATAVAKLQPMLHGTIVDNTDYYAMQAGPCSVYGGVEAWCGAPARQLPLTSNERMLTNGLGSRFSLYNATCLVNQQVASGTQQLSASRDIAETLTAAALLRLPFPTNPNMVTTGIVYHSGTEDYDLDPGREGASAGFFSYAVGYPSGFTVNLTSTVDPHAYVVYKNFVNGLTQLSVTGQAKIAEHSYILVGSDYVASATTALAAAAAPYTRLISNYNTWDFTGTDLLSVLANLRHFRGQQISGTFTAITYNAALTDIHSARTTGIRAFNVLGTLLATHPLCDYIRPNILPEWTSPDVSVDNVLICTAPGAIVVSLANALVDAAFALQLDLHDGGGGKLGLYNTLVMAATAVGDSVYGGTLDVTDTPYKFDAASVYQPQVDVVRFPLVSHGSVAPHNGIGASGIPYGSGRTSLKGSLIAYPGSWSAASITAAEALWAASTGINTTYGRGIYVGNTTSRYCAPVMVPGSGTPLLDVLYDQNVMLPDSTEQAPQRFPVAPGQPMFATSNRRWIKYDHGGQAAYVGLGMMINPSSNQYQGRLVLQFSGGPVGKQSINGTNTEIPEGTALDAFWPSGRPILTQLKKK